MAKWGTNSWEIEELKRHDTRLGVLQSLISPTKGKEEKKKKILQHGVFVFGHPSRCESAEKGLTLLSERDVVQSLWYSASQLGNGSFANSNNFDATDLGFSPLVKFKLKPTGIM